MGANKKNDTDIYTILVHLPTSKYIAINLIAEDNLKFEPDTTNEGRYSDFAGREKKGKLIPPYTNKELNIMMMIPHYFPNDISNNSLVLKSDYVQISFVLKWVYIVYDLPNRNQHRGIEKRTTKHICCIIFVYGGNEEKCFCNGTILIAA